MAARAARFFFFGLLMLVPVALVSVFFYALFAPIDLPARLEAATRASTILDRDGVPIATLYGQNRVWVPLTRIPAFLRRAVVAVEDARFHRHLGVDPRGILRAFYQNLRTGRIEQGGSTITQQLAKIALLSPKRTLLRKLSDIALALRIERRYSKDQILEFYLNEIYLGHGAFGVEAAAQTYFGRHVWELNRKESLMLAGLIRGPEYYSPFRNPEAAQERLETAAELMRRFGGLKTGAQKRVMDQPLRLLASPGRTEGGYFINQVLRELRTKFGWSEEFIRRSGLEIRTTMDGDLQRAAEDTIRLLPAAPEKSGGVVQPQGAIVVMNPADGAVLAMVGGRDYLTSPLNRATQSRRQPGSAIKPFAYALAMEQGYTPETIYVDEPTEFWINGRLWRPKNYDQEYRGPITLREALEYSVNVVAARLVNDLGPRAVFDFARSAGLSSLVPSGTRNDVGLAPLALGGLTRGVTPLELTAAYAVFPNGGYRVEPYFYTSVTDARGRVVAAGRPKRTQVLSARAAHLVTEMLRGVIERGTGVRAQIGRPAAGKTGTTTDFTNGWFIGYTPELVAGIWIGNDRGDQPMRTAEGNLGSGMAAALWGVLMNRALAGLPARDFTYPGGAAAAGTENVPPDRAVGAPGRLQGSGAAPLPLP